MVFPALALSFLFLLIVAPLWVSFPTPIMNSLTATAGENSEKHASIYSCLYCKKVFTNHRALGGHLKTHNIEIKSRWRRHPPGRSSISIGIASTHPSTLSNNQPENSSGVSGNNSPCSNKIIPVHAMAFPPSGSTAATGVPLDPSLCLGLPGICQFITDEDRTPRDGIPFFNGDALLNFQHNLSKPSFAASTVANPNAGLDLNLLPGFKETTSVGSFSMDPYPCLGQDEGCQYNIKNSLTCEEGKRQYSFDAVGNSDMVKASKRPKIISILPVEIEKFQNKEVLFFKDVEKPLTGSEMPFDTEQEGPADLDLSLHL